MFLENLINDMDLQNPDVSEAKLTNQLDIMAIASSNCTFSIHNENSSNSHQLITTNSFEMNGATSLSEDSGLPHTNSSGLCRFEFEVTIFYKLTVLLKFTI